MLVKLHILLMLVEQGIIGCLLFILLIYAVLFRGQMIYNRTLKVRDKSFVAIVLLSFIIVLLNIFLSDLIETPKVGPFFFMAIALLVNMELKAERSEDLTVEHADVVDVVN